MPPALVFQVLGRLGGYQVGAFISACIPGVGVCPHQVLGGVDEIDEIAAELYYSQFYHTQIEEMPMDIADLIWAHC